jgi:type II secretory pathway component GspD/PulD (secretin)
MVDAEVLVANGETAVLGGLSREAGSNGGAGVPGLRRVPGLGALFGRKSDVSEDEELVVLVTPRVVD